MARDNFNQPVVDKLKARVAHRCSNPGCRVPTSAPSGDDSINSIGVAAHICAASPGGPRYNKSMTVVERKSIDNAIWLCSNCSIDIDRDEKRYSVCLLKEWRVKAEDSARAELGKKLPSNSDAIDTVAVALTGCPKRYIASAISNVHLATGIALESLDPRFIVKTAHDDGKTSIGIYAKEDVSLSMKINCESVKEYTEKHRQLMEHGKDIEIKSEGITVEGSKLFEEIFGNNDGVLHISPKKIEATQKLWLVQNDTNIVESFDDIQGVISCGSKSFTFNGIACNKIFSFSCQMSLDGSNDNKAHITMSLCLDQWEGVSLKYLPYLDKLLSLFTKMAQGWTVFTSLEINGTKFLCSAGMKVDKWDYILETSSLLHYAIRCKIISESLRHEIKYTSNVSYTAEEHKHIANIVEALEGKLVYNASNITSNITCELIVDDECKNVKLLTEATETSSMRMVQEAGEKIEMFGIEVKLPAKIIYLEDVLPKIHGEIDKLKSGDLVKVEWIPQKNFKYSVSYQS